MVFNENKVSHLAHFFLNHELFKYIVKYTAGINE